jgi:hypothetical protein
MKRSYFAPDDFDVTPERMNWAIQTFGITAGEVERQTDEWHDFEYKRAYSDWNRAWRRWFRQADKYDTLRREHKPRLVEVISDEQLVADRLKADRELAVLTRR